MGWSIVPEGHGDRETRRNSRPQNESGTGQGKWVVIGEITDSGYLISQKLPVL